MAKTKRPSSAARSSQKGEAIKPPGIRGELLERGDGLSVAAADLIAMLQDKCYELGLEIRDLKGE